MLVAIRGTTQKFPKFEHSVQTIRSTVVNRYALQAVSSVNQSAKGHRALCTCSSFMCAVLTSC
jgi:hypothetical protein